MPEQHEYERFKWAILADAVFEDRQGVWEPLWWLRGGGAIQGQSEASCEEFAERALRELYADGLIYFFRAPWTGADLNSAGMDEASSLTSEAVDEMLRDNWWRGEGPLPTEDLIWWNATPAGQLAGRDQSGKA